MNTKKAFILQAGLILFLLAACAAPKPQPTPTPTLAPSLTPIVGVPGKTGIEYHFVTNKLLLPTTHEQSQAFALNVDGDAQQHLDNLFGDLLSLLISASPGLELQATIDKAINAGQMIALHVVWADDPMNTSNASWSFFLGQKPQAAPRFDGSDNFTLDPAAPTNSLITGSLTNGHFAGGPGSARVQIALMGQPVGIDLIGVRLESDVSAAGCANGKLGGGVTAAEFHDKLLPTLVDGFNRIVKTGNTSAKTILSVFDADQDGAISVAELENNILLKLATSPDLDLLDASGKFNPSQDGVKDSLSIGLGFTCVPATFMVTTK